MTQTRLDRLRARGEVVVHADSGGYSVSWWPKGQRGNPFCGRSGSGPVLDSIVAEIEEATRPQTRDWDDARWARERQAKKDAEDRQRFWLRTYDQDDRRREKAARDRVERQKVRERDERRRQRQRVYQALSG